ncbi:glycerate kinase type-2 family protein [Frigidibacter sp. MR17.24]|uniref:glycerate kinase type-2 family protein n=1 Tax=Frigidibacter sp. MR17.24 TaxID=3127345 RepID=UPI003012E50F
MSGASDRALLRALFDAAVAAAQPARALPPALPPRPDTGRVVVVGAGKAAAAMAAALEQAWGPCEGLVVTRYGQSVPCDGIRVPCDGIRVREAAHPVPDAAGTAAAAEMLALAQGLGAGDTMVALISGGASSLLSLPVPGVTAAEKAALTQALLASGAPIEAMNCVRRHVSAIKGGRLAAAAHPARVVTLLISDVPGDDPAAIGSGPTVGDPTTLAEARAILARHGIDPPPGIAAALADPANETPPPGAPRLAATETRIVASPQRSLLAAAAVATVPCHLLGDAIEGEAREVGRAFGGLARAAACGHSGFAAPCILLSGGETTVTLRPGAEGRGGRNVEFLMGLAEAIGGIEGITALAADTDGVDGAAEVAGAFVDGGTAARARAAGLPLPEAMRAHDGHGLFKRLGDQLVTGPTGTNVNDFRAILIR